MQKHFQEADLQQQIQERPPLPIGKKEIPIIFFV
jgi:hypothetical protein